MRSCHSVDGENSPCTRASPSLDFDFDFPFGFVLVAARCLAAARGATASARVVCGFAGMRPACRAATREGRPPSPLFARASAGRALFFTAGPVREVRPAAARRTGLVEPARFRAGGRALVLVPDPEPGGRFAFFTPPAMGAPGSLPANGRAGRGGASCDVRNSRVVRWGHPRRHRRAGQPRRRNGMENAARASGRRGIMRSFATAGMKADGPGPRRRRGPGADRR